jgi:hypothetical protein
MYEESKEDSEDWEDEYLNEYIYEDWANSENDHDYNYRSDWPN